MAYVELEQFLGRGNEKVIWILSQNAIVGGLLGFFLGQRLGLLLFDHRMAVGALAILGVVAGLTLAAQYHGMMIGRRVWIRARYLVRRLTRMVEVNGMQYETSGLSDEEAAAAGWGSKVRPHSVEGGRPMFRPASRRSMVYDTADTPPVTISSD